MRFFEDDGLTEVFPIEVQVQTDAEQDRKYEAELASLSLNQLILARILEVAAFPEMEFEDKDFKPHPLYVTQAKTLTDVRDLGFYLMTMMRIILK